MLDVHGATAEPTISVATRYCPRQRIWTRSRTRYWTVAAILSCVFNQSVNQFILLDQRVKNDWHCDRNITKTTNYCAIDFVPKFITSVTSPFKLSNSILRQSSFPHTDTFSAFEVSYKTRYINSLLLTYYYF